jgi:hypothetical protein
MLYFCKIDENTIVTHDGRFQLGIVHMSVQSFLKMTKAEYTEVYWVPDPVSKRYKSLSYQRHLRAVEGLSTTD